MLSMLYLSCSQKQEENDIEIIIEEPQSYKYDLTHRVFTTYYMTKPKIEVKFKLSEDEESAIKKKYYDLKIYEINQINNITGNTLIDDDCGTMPKFYTIIKIKKPASSQEIQIDKSCDNFYLSNFVIAHRIKEFIKIVTDILQSKPEIENVPKSDIIYM